jgi:hypothetical protein
VTSSTSVVHPARKPNSTIGSWNAVFESYGPLEPARAVAVDADDVVVDQQVGDAQLLGTLGERPIAPGSVPIS